MLQQPRHRAIQQLYRSLRLAGPSCLCVDRQPEDGRKTAVKEVYALDRCLFARDRFQVRVGEANLSEGTSTGRCGSGGHVIGWDLRSPMTAPSLPGKYI